ncbi:MAG: hypothetical protein ABIJ21_01615 [Nanoarchaeota archaeon]
MKELFANLPHVQPQDLRLREQTILLDTCFLVHALQNRKEKDLIRLMEQYPVGLTSFNVDELDHIRHKIDEHVREALRKLLHHNQDLIIVGIPVHPGNRRLEEDYIRTIDPVLFSDVPDPSDAVLMAVAIQTLSSVLTRDKHHLFTTKLQNYIQKYGIAVYKDFHEVPGWTA